MQRIDEILKNGSVILKKLCFRAQQVRFEAGYLQRWIELAYQTEGGRRRENVLIVWSLYTTLIQPISCMQMLTSAHLPFFGCIDTKVEGPVMKL